LDKGGARDIYAPSPLNQRRFPVIKPLSLQVEKEWSLAVGRMFWESNATEPMGPVEALWFLTRCDEPLVVEVAHEFLSILASEVYLQGGSSDTRRVLGTHYGRVAVVVAAVCSAASSPSNVGRPVASVVASWVAVNAPYYKQVADLARAG
jgi:hypothetical protein